MLSQDASAPEKREKRQVGGGADDSFGAAFRR